MQGSLNFVHWNRDGWKVGLCSVPPVLGAQSKAQTNTQLYSLLTLANNTCIRHTFTDVKERFYKLYKRKAHLHHYSQVEGFDEGEFSLAAESLDQLMSEYEELELAEKKYIGNH